MDTRAAGSELEESEKVGYVVLSFKARELPAAYRNMIFSKWLRSLRYGNDYFRLIDQNSYFDNYHRYIEILLARPSSMVHLAALSDDRDVVLGFSVTEHTALHYVHVQKDHRNCGIGTALIPAKIEWITHLTKAGMSIWNAKMKEANFDPFYQHTGAI